MRPRLVIALVILLVAPVIAASTLLYRVLADERLVLRQNLTHLLDSRLADLDAAVARLMAARRHELETVLEVESLRPADLRARVNRSPLVSAIFAVDANGALLFPSPQGSLTSSERDFLDRTRQVWLKGDLLLRPAETTARTAPPTSEKVPSKAQSAAVVPELTDARAGGWYAWYWENGLHLLYWRRLAGDGVVGAELNAARLAADVLNELPTTDARDTLAQGERTRLMDARGEVIYQWGGYEPAANERPRAERQLAAPLSAWKLQVFMSGNRFEAALGRSAVWSLGLSLVALMLVVSGLGIYFYRESAKSLREATERVSFVNQVSHELKTPLTNIRMYAELLEREVDDADPRAQKHLGIIVAESQRLSRLIGNVLTFARQQRHTLKLRPGPALLDEVIGEVLHQFAPSLEEKAIEVRFVAGAPARVRLDADLVAQVVANLVSNVEKYAAKGGLLEVTTARVGNRATVRVKDRGPGIPAEASERVFEPFVRLTNAVTEGVSGTGIGLSIARDLARLHGGDLTLVPTEVGATFELTLFAPQVTDHESAHR